MKYITVGDQLLHTEGRTDKISDRIDEVYIHVSQFYEIPKTVHFHDWIFSLLQATHFIETYLLRKPCDTCCSEL